MELENLLGFFSRNTRLEIECFTVTRESFLRWSTTFLVADSTLSISETNTSWMLSAESCYRKMHVLIVYMYVLHTTYVCVCNVN